MFVLAVGSQNFDVLSTSLTKKEKEQTVEDLSWYVFNIAGAIHNILNERVPQEIKAMYLEYYGINFGDGIVFEKFKKKSLKKLLALAEKSFYDVERFRAVPEFENILMSG